MWWCWGGGENAELPKAPQWESRAQDPLLNPSHCGGEDSGGGTGVQFCPGSWASLSLTGTQGSDWPFPLDRRFHHLLTDHRRWIRERSHESYAKNYSVVFPHDEPLAGRNMRTDPLHEVPHLDRHGDARGVQGTGVTEGHVAPQFPGG